MVDTYAGRVICDRYEIEALIGKGGMGRVYRATQRSLGRKVAVKFIEPAAAVDSIAKRFLIEAQASSRLNHPNVVRVFDFGRTSRSDGGDLFMVMELLSGTSLATVMEPCEPIGIARALGILRQVLAALGEAHHAGITHRDVKPENIMIETQHDGSELVKMIDFGIAKIMDGKPKKGESRVFGTPTYMAPEQVTLGKSGPSADLYSAAVILFELLAGQEPFIADSPIEVVRMHAKAARPDLRKTARGRDIPDRIAEACARAMAIRPEDRFADAEAFAQALSPHQAHA